MMEIGREVMRECLGSEGIQDLAQWCLTAFHGWKPKRRVSQAQSKGSCGGFVVVVFVCLLFNSITELHLSHSKMLYLFSPILIIHFGNNYLV